MNRRSVLGMFGIGATAAPAIAKQMIYQSSYPSPGLSTPANFVDQPIPWNPVETLAHVKKEYEMMTGDSSAWITDYVTRELEEYHSGYSSFRFEHIDSDIRNMKSLSETTKIRMHFERKAKRRYESTSRNLLHRIQELMKEV